MFTFYSFYIHIYQQSFFLKNHYVKFFQNITVQCTVIQNIWFFQNVTVQCTVYLLYIVSQPVKFFRIILYSVQCTVYTSAQCFLIFLFLLQYYCVKKCMSCKWLCSKNLKISTVSYKKDHSIDEEWNTWISSSLESRFLLVLLLLYI